MSKLVPRNVKCYLPSSSNHWKKREGTKIFPFVHFTLILKSPSPCPCNTKSTRSVFCLTGPPEVCLSGKKNVCGLPLLVSPNQAVLLSIRSISLDSHTEGSRLTQPSRPTRKKTNRPKTSPFWKCTLARCWVTNAPGCHYKVTDLGKYNSLSLSGLLVQYKRQHRVTLYNSKPQFWQNG